MVCQRPGCERQLTRPCRGPMPRFCSDACRKAASRMGSGGLEEGDVPSFDDLRYAVRFQGCGHTAAVVSPTTDGMAYCPTCRAHRYVE
jgi:hypothetical protein